MGMRKRMCLALVCVSVVICSSWGGVKNTFAAEKILSGTVKTATNDTLVLVFEQSDQMRISEMVFSISPQTQFEQIASASDLKEGDIVEVQYQETGVSKVALKVLLSDKDEEAAAEVSIDKG